MPRLPRIDAPGVIHHVIIRGIEKESDLPGPVGLWRFRVRSHFLIFIFDQRIVIHLCQQKTAQPVEEAIFVCIVQEYPLAVDPPCDHVLQGAGWVNS